MAFARKFKGHIHNINHHCHSDASFELRYFVRASRNSDTARTAALISLCGNNLIVERAQLKAKFAPGIEMVCGSDSPSNTLACTDRPVLLKGRCSDNRRLIGSSADVDVVRATVAADLAFVSQACRWIIGSVGFDNAAQDVSIQSTGS